MSSYCLPKWLYHFAFPQVMNESSCCSTYLSAFGDASVLNFGHSNRCVVISHCFNLHFPSETRCGVSVHMLICHLYIFFDEMFVKVFSPLPPTPRPLPKLSSVQEAKVRGKEGTMVLCSPSVTHRKGLGLFFNLVVWFLIVKF